MSIPVMDYSRRVPRAIRFQWTAEDGVTPIDCSTFACSVEETTLPWTPAIIPIDAAQGWFELAAPSEAQAGGLRPGRRYGLTVVMRADGSAVSSWKIVLRAQ